MTLEEYFIELEGVFERANQRGNEQPELAAFFAGGASWEESRAFFATLSDGFDEFLREFDAIDPPLAAESLHVEYSEGLRDGADIMRTVSEFEEEADAAGFLQGAENRLFASLLGAGATCEELNIVAQDGGIDIALPCTAFSR